MEKILIVTPFFVPAYSYGGIVKVAYDQALGLVKKGFDVTVVTTDVLDARDRIKVLKENIEGIKIIRFRNISNYLAKYQNLYLPIGMKKWLKNNIKNYDVVHIHDIYNLSTYWACKYSLEEKKKYFIQPHGTLSDVRIQSRKSYIKKWILSKMKKYFNQANGFFALTKFEIEEIKKVTDNGRIYELPNGIDIKKFDDIKKIDIHKEFGLTKETKIIAFLGRVQYIKGLDISLEILAQLDKTFTNRRFLIIGPNEGEQAKLIELSKKLGVEDKIIWYGLENTDKRYSLLKGSDLFLFNSRSEGFPMTLLEAIACGLPVLISEGCNLPEVDEFKAGKIVDNKIDASDKAKILYNLLLHRDDYIIGGKELINTFSLDNLIYNLIKYYEKCY